MAWWSSTGLLVSFKKNFFKDFYLFMIDTERERERERERQRHRQRENCLLYTSDAADDRFLV